MSVGLMIAGSALSIYGQWQANRAQAEAARRNALWAEEQAQFIERAGEREKSILKESGDRLKGEQISTIAKAGVDMTGTAAILLMNTEVQVADEMRAIEDQINMKVREARFQAAEQREIARTLRSPTYNLMQSAGTGLKFFSLT